MTAPFYRWTGRGASVPLRKLNEQPVRPRGRPYEIGQPGVEPTRERGGVFQLFLVEERADRGLAGGARLGRAGGELGQVAGVERGDRRRLPEQRVRDPGAQKGSEAD